MAKRGNVVCKFCPGCGVPIKRYHTHFTGDFVPFIQCRICKSAWHRKEDGSYGGVYYPPKRPHE